jgi:hypothetical protein
MKKILLIVLALVLAVLPLAACKNDPAESDVPTDPYGLSVSVKNVTDTGLTFVFSRKTDDGTELSVGNPYRLERDFHGRWVPVENILEEGQELVFTTEAYVLPTGNYEMNIDWAWAYGNLKPGTYRITKGVTARKDGAPTGAFSYSATFVIEGETTAE